MINTSALKSIREKAYATAVRFPLPLLIVVIAAGCLIWMIDAKEKDPYFFNVLHLVLTLSLALPAFTGLCFFAERGKHTFFIQLIGQLVLFLMGTWYYQSIPVSFGEKEAAKHVILVLSMHLWVAFAPFVRYREIQGFWQYNKSLFIRFITAFLYSVVLFGGLSLAIFAVDQLFDVRIDEENYLRLWILIAIVFNTWFFLSDLPIDLDELNNSNEYPNGLRLFTQFVLLPLVTIYLSILYVYMFKIMITANWPKGWVAYLVVGFSTAGILALLLVWPLQSNDRFKWIKVYVRYFFMALFPLIIMLGFAIYIRVRDYGITENRYFIIVLALWLFANSLYFLFSTVKNIKVIPMSLFFVALLSGFGSWNAFTVSKDSQSKRLLTYAEQYGLLKNGKIVAVENGIVIPDSVLVEMSSITHYLIVSHGLDVMKNLLAINLDSLNDKSSRYDLSRKVMSQLNLKYINGNEWGMDQVKFFNLSCNDEVNPLNVEGFSFYKSFNYYSGNRDFEQELRIDSLKILHLAYEENKHVLSCRINDEKSISFRMDPFVEKLFSEYSTSNHSILEKDMTIYFENDKFKCKVLFSSIAGNYRSEKNIEKLNSMEMKVLYVGK